jgi:hypothetical protein
MTGEAEWSGWIAQQLQRMVATVWIVTLVALGIEDGLVNNAAFRLGVAVAAQLLLGDDQLVRMFLKIDSGVARFALLLRCGAV